MQLHLDTDLRTLEYDRDGEKGSLDLYSREAFEVLADAYLKVAWDQKYVYTFSWLGRPIIQLPDDMVRMQEVIHTIQPDVIVETGVAHGGSLVYYASLCKALERGRVIGVDIEIRPHNRTAIEAHPMASMIQLVEGDSTAADTVAQVKDAIEPGETVLVSLDSNHTKAHVSAELEAYHGLVTPGSYIVVMDGYLESLTDVPRGDGAWLEDNPKAAAEDFVQSHPEFEIVQPEWPFNESDLSRNVTHWPGAWLKKVR